jgi:hypothetical protein
MERTYEQINSKFSSYKMNSETTIASLTKQIELVRRFCLCLYVP